MFGLVRDFTSECWTEVTNRVIGAVAFLDEPSAENLHWHGGLSAVLGAGAVAVKALSPFEFALKDQKKAVFVCSCTPTQLQTMREVIQHSNFSHCIIVSTASLDVVGAEVVGDLARDGSDINPKKLIEDMVLKWINKKQSAVEVIHVPVFAISPSPLTFMTPTFSTVTPSFQGQINPKCAPVDLYSISEQERADVRRLAGCLSSMFASMNIKEDVYYMGAFSSLIAGVLEFNPLYAGRRKNCNRPASLIIVDRTLDLCTIASHSSECMLDKILAVLPNFPGHSVDVAVDMSPLCEANMLSPTDDIQLSPGCLWHSNDSASVQTFERMMTKSTKEVLFHLHEKLPRPDFPRSPAPRPTSATIEKTASATKGRYDLIERNLGLLEQALAVTQTLKSAAHSQLELLQGFEEQALQNIATSRDSTGVLNQISHLIKTRKDRNLSLDRLLSLCVYVYSLAGHDVNFSSSHEGNLLRALTSAFVEDQAALLPDVKVLAEDEAKAMAESIVERLKDIGQTRKILTKYASILKSTAPGMSEVYRGLTQQLVEDLVDPTRPELVDLKHRNEGFKDLLKTGFKMLLNSGPKKKHPIDTGLVFLYIVGGTTAEECRTLQRAVVASGTDAHFIVGSTRFAPPVWTARTLLMSQLSA